MNRDVQFLSRFDINAIDSFKVLRQIFGPHLLARFSLIPNED